MSQLSLNGGQDRAKISLRLLGGASLEVGDGPLTGPTVQRHRLALLALLAVAHPAAVPRDKLTAYLWPERDTEHARNLLSQAIYVLRKALGDGALLATGDELRFNASVIACDVVAFAQALAAGDRAGAVELYRGPLLDGFFLAGAPELERWVERERQRLAAEYGEALEALAALAERERDHGTAVQWWRARAAHDPYDSRIALGLMRALEASGNPAGALQHAAVHERLLQQELGVEPSVEVRAAVGALRNRREAREPSHGAVLAPVGRNSPPCSGSAGAGIEAGVGTPQPQGGHDARRSPMAVRGDRWWNPSVALALAGVLAIVGLRSVASSGPASGSGSARPSAERGTIASRAPVASRGGVRSPRAIVVLPFTNLSSDPDDAYFSDGLTEELTTALSRVRALRVVARASAFAFKDEHRDIRAIGRALDVGTVLDGSVRRDGDRVRVTAQLIDAENGFHLWAQTYERHGSDLLAIQADLAPRIASALELELTPREQAQLARRPTTSAEAHALYLKGRFFWNQRTAPAYTRAIEYFERAAAADPRYARAYAGLASVYAMQGWQGQVNPREAGERARATALRALELDDQLAEAHTVLGAYFDAYAWNSDAAERELRRAIELDSSHATAHHWYGNFLTAMGRLDEAIAHKREAVALDPLAPVLSESLGHTLLCAGRFDEAFEAYRSAIELDPTFWRAHAGLGALYEARGQLAEAMEAHRRAVALAGTDGHARAGLARILARAGRQDEARTMLAELREEASRVGIHQPGVATVFLAMDDVEGALAWLEQSYRERVPQLRHIGGPTFRRLDDDPRYIGLLRRAGLGHR